MAITTNVPSNNFEDLQRDVQDATRFTNATAPFTNRVGQSITPIPVRDAQLAEKVAEAAYAVEALGWFPVAGSFTDGGTITARNQVLFNDADSSFYSWSGALPKVVPAASTPASTGGISANAWVNRGDAALRSALAAPDSTVPVGGVEAGKLSKRSDAGFRTIEEFGGGINVADNTAAWQALLASGAKWAHFGGNGSYKFLGSTTHNADIQITASPNAVIDCSDPSFVGGHWTRITGSKTTLPFLSSTVQKGALELTFLSAPNLSPGDIFILFNPTISSWSAFRTVYFAGEFCEVVSVSGNTVKLASPLYDSYTFGTLDVYKVNPVRVLTNGLTIVGDKSTSLLDIEFGRHCYIGNPKSNHKNNSVISFIRCYNCVVDNPDIYNRGTGIGDDYGIVVTNSQTIKIHSGKVHSRRHAVTTGGDGEAGAVPCRDLLFDGVTISNDPDSGVFAADFHGNTEASKYVNCTIYGGAAWQGKNNGYENCIIHDMKIGVCIYSAEIVGGTLYARNCTMFSNVDPSVSSRGIVDVGGNQSSIDSRTVEDVTFDLTGTTINGQNLSAITSMFIMRNRGSVNKINIKVDDMTINANNFGQVLFTALDGGTALSDFIIVDNIISPLTGKLLCNHSANAYASFPHKLQSQSGRQTVTTNTSASAVAGATQSFKWRYPKIPVAVINAVNVGYVGTKLPQGYLDIGALTAQSIIPWLATPDATNFSSARSIDVCWQVSIDEV